MRKKEKLKGKLLLLLLPFFHFILLHLLKDNVYALKRAGLIEAKTQHHLLPHSNAGTPLKSGFDPDCVSELWPGLGYTAESIYKTVPDWFLKAGVHFTAVENIQITLNTLDRIITVYHKTLLWALPSSPVNRPKGREGWNASETT